MWKSACQIIVFLRLLPSKGVTDMGLFSANQ
jgi:hypothetical protein